MGGRAGDDIPRETSSSRTDPLIGALVNGKFRVKEAIARGGMGRIYYALQEPLGRPVALKVVQGDGDQEHESQFLKRFVQEASILAKLQHPNVVTLFDYGRIEGPIEQFFIAMEYLAGETLAARMKTRGVMTPAEVLVLTRQIARGLREAHVRGIVHRDLKPSNIILVREADGGEIVKLVDFGIGKMVEANGEQELTQDGFVVGTPRYMAPEQFDGTAVPASDLYSLGSIMYQALTGKLPFKGATMSEFMVAKFAQEIPRMSDMSPGLQIPESVEVLVAGLLARRAEERPTMEQLFASLKVCELEVFGGAMPAGATGPYPAWSTGPVPAYTPGSLPPVQVMPSNPPTGSGVRPSVGSLRVPYTQVAPMNSFTPRPQSVPTPEPPASNKGSGFAVVLLGALVLAGGVGGIAWSKAHKTQAPAGGAPTGVSSTTSAQPTPEIAPTFKLVIDSTPQGANVVEGDKVLGTTPLQLALDRAAVSTTPRTFQIQKEGFVTTSFVQGSSTKDEVATTIALAAAPAETVKSHDTKPPVHNGGGGGGTGTTVKPPVTANGQGQPPPGGTDIRLKR